MINLIFPIILCGLTLLIPRVQAESSPPNVLILFTDDHGTLDANCYGSDDLITPNIDKLAETGVRFTQAYAHTVCCPSRAALMTGRHPQRGGVYHWTQGDMNAAEGINMALEEVTLAEVLQEAGYRTALYGKWHLGAHRDHGPMKQGFDEFFGIRDGFIDNYNHYFLHGNGFHDLYEGTEEVWADGEYFPDLMVDRSLKFLEENQDQPFFLYVPFNIPHYPEQALAKYTKMYEGMEDRVRASYAAMISTTDSYIGQVIDKLEELDLRENTIVIFMSDNGASAEDNKGITVDKHKSGYPKGHYYSANGGGGFTGKWIGNKGTFLEGGLRVPTIVSYPAQLPQGEVRDQIVTAMDWYPTVLDLCGVKPKADAPVLDGHSLVPIIESADAESGYGGVLHFAWGANWAVRDGDWKLIAKVPKNPDLKAKLSLHHLADENPEVEDYSKAKPDLVERLTKLHDAWAANVEMEW